MVSELKARAKMISTTEEIAQVRGVRAWAVWGPGGSGRGAQGAGRRAQLARSGCVPTPLRPAARPPSQVGTISANGEREIGELIARAMEKVGEVPGLVHGVLRRRRKCCPAGTRALH